MWVLGRQTLLQDTLKTDGDEFLAPSVSASAHLCCAEATHDPRGPQQPFVLVMTLCVVLAGLGVCGQRWASWGLDGLGGSPLYSAGVGWGH